MVQNNDETLLWSIFIGTPCMILGRQFTFIVHSSVFVINIKKFWATSLHFCTQFMLFLPQNVYVMCARTVKSTVFTLGQVHCIICCCSRKNGSRQCCTSCQSCSAWMRWVHLTTARETGALSRTAVVDQCQSVRLVLWPMLLLLYDYHSTGGFPDDEI